MTHNHLIGLAGDNSQLQERVFAFLADPTTHNGSSVRRIDTHAAVVFLAGDRALKIKRAISLPFLDYSTLDKRRTACSEELKVNAAFAPALYRRIIPITKHGDDGFEIDGAGKIVEWAVEMVRFNEDHTLDRIAKRETLDERLAMEIADAIVKSHAIASPVVHAGWVSSIGMLIDGNTRTFRAVSGLPVDQIDSLDVASRFALESQIDNLTRRTAHGFVRRGHGDLHLANIALIDNKPVLFDALEFNPAIATTDVLYDLAFPIMDCLHFNQATAANIIFNHYLSNTPAENIEGLGAIPLFLSIRAAIRANVLFTRTDQTDDSDIRSEANNYFSLACRLISPRQPMLIAVGGLSGTGKSVLAHKLADRIEPPPGAIIVQSDMLRKRMFGMSATSPLPDAAYQAAISRKLYRAVGETASRILAQGCSAIVDATFMERAERDAMRAVARQRGTTFKAVFLVTDTATRIRRVGARTNDVSDANPEIARRQESHQLGVLDWPRIDATGTPEQTLQYSLREIEAR